MEIKTSQEWLDTIPGKYGLQILDPDGWDRSGDFDYSFNEEKITKEEFQKRLSISTIQCSIDFFTANDW